MEEGADAREQKIFVNLHTKAGEKEILDLLEKYDVRRAIIHWYSGPMDILRAMIDFGCYSPLASKYFSRNTSRGSPRPCRIICC